MIFVDHPLIASALFALGFLFWLFSFWHSEHQLMKAPASWKLRKLPEDDIDHAEFDISGYMLGWTDRFKLGEFSHIGFGESPLLGFSYFHSYHLKSLIYRVFCRVLYRSKLAELNAEFVKTVGLQIYSIPTYFKQLHMLEIPTTLKTCGRFTRVRVTGRILQNLAPLSSADFNGANTDGWGQDHYCPFVVIDSIQIEPCLFSRLRIAWQIMPS